MKKVILPLVALMLSMVACQKENEGILTLEVEEYNTDAKLHLDDANYAVWDNDDAIWINGAFKHVSISEENGTATISGVSSSETGYKAFYPSSLERAYYHDDGTLLIEILSTQTYRTNDTGKQVIDAPMAAYSTGGSLQFKNLGSILAVNVSGVERVRSIKVIATDDDNRDVSIAGETSIDFSGDRPTLETTNGNSNCITLYCGGVEIPVGGSKTFYIAIPSVEAKLTIIVDDGACRYTKSQNDAMTFVSSHGYNVPFDASEVTDPEQYAPKSTEIWYTSSNDRRIDITGMNSLGIFSNVYNDGKGVITFNSAVSTFPDNLFANAGRANLQSLSLPYSLTTFANNTFRYYTNLTTINYYYYNNPESINSPRSWGLRLSVFDKLHLLQDLPGDYATIWRNSFPYVEFDLE